MLFGKIVSHIYAIRAGSAYQKGDIDQALSLLDKAYKTGCAKANLVIAYGYILLKHGKLDESFNILSSQLNNSKLSKSDSFEAKLNYALVLWKKGQLDKAISLYEAVIPHYTNSNIYGSLGYLYILQGDLEKALAFNLKAYDYNSSNGVILDNLGQNYYLLGQLEKADEVFKKLMELKPKFPEAYYDYALVLEKSGAVEQSIEKLKTALLYKPNFLSAITTEDIQKKLSYITRAI